MTKIKIKTISLPQFEGKEIENVHEYLKKEYPNSLPFDGVDFYDNEVLKDGNYHFFFGSVFRDSDGDWCVPYVRWDGSSFLRDASWLEFSWDSPYRVVVLETVESGTNSLALPLETLASLELRVKKLESLFSAELIK